MPADPPPPLTAAQAEQAAALWRAIMSSGARRHLVDRHRDGRLTVEGYGGRTVDIPLGHAKLTASINPT